MIDDRVRRIKRTANQLFNFYQMSAREYAKHYGGRSNSATHDARSMAKTIHDEVVMLEEEIEEELKEKEYEMSTDERLASEGIDQV